MDELALPELQIVDEIGSTNDVMLEQARAGAPAGTAAAAHVQTAGRGRRGHVWQSPRGGLYLSVLLRPAVPMQNFVGLPAVCALGALRGLESLGYSGLSLKWPNDLMVGDAKLGGLIVEGGSSEAGVFAVCGIGINLQRPEAALVQEIAGAHDGSIHPLPPAYLSDAAAVSHSFDEAASAVRAGICAEVQRWEAAVTAGRAQAGPLAPILSEYFDCVELLGKLVDVLLPTGEVCMQGTFAGIDVWGRATIVGEDGRELEISAEQGSIRPAATAH